MANKSLITYGAKIGQVDLNYYAPVAVVPPANTTISQTYCFLAKAEPWPDENNPPVPTQDVKSLKQIFKNIIQPICLLSKFCSMTLGLIASILVTYVLLYII